MNSSFLGLETLTTLQIGVIFCASLIGAGWDIHSRRIPNWLTFPMMITGLAFSALTYGPYGLLGSFAALLIVSLPYVLLFIFAGGGGGDAKIMAGIGAWAGFMPGLCFLGGVALAGIVAGTAFALYRGQFREVFSRIRAMAYRTIPALTHGFGAIHKSLPDAAEMNQSVSQPMPYGIAIFGGVCLVLAIRVVWF